MYIAEYGIDQSQTIVLIHGGGVAGWSFSQQNAVLTNFHRLIVDLPGHGLSQGSFSIDDSVEQIAQIIETRAHGGRAHLVGHSIGAKITLQLLLTHSRLVHKAVICSAVYADNVLIRLLADKTANKLSLAMLKNPAVKKMQVEQFAFPTAEMKAAFLSELEHTSLDTLLAVGSEMLRTGTIPAGLTNVCVPVLIVYGGREVLAAKQSAQILHKAIASSQLCVIEKAQHNYPWTHAEELNKLLIDFLAQA